MSKPQPTQNDSTMETITLDLNDSMQLTSSFDDITNSEDDDDSSLSSSESSNMDSPHTDQKSFRLDLDDVPLTEGIVFE